MEPRHFLLHCSWGNVKSSLETRLTPNRPLDTCRTGVFVPRKPLRQKYKGVRGWDYYCSVCSGDHCLFEKRRR